MIHQTYTVEWSQAAAADLDAIIEVIAHDRPMAALRMFSKIEDRAAALSNHPLRGRIVPELAAVQVRLYRELQVTPYRLLYRVVGDRVFVLGVFDGRRNLEDILLERLVTGSSVAPSGSAKNPR